MNNRISPSQRYNLLHLFSLVWIKWHLSLIAYSSTFNKLLLSVEAEIVLQLTIENKEVSSGKSLKSDIGHCLKLLI